MDHFAYALAEQQIADRARQTRPRHAAPAPPTSSARRRTARGLRRIARALDSAD